MFRRLYDWTMDQATKPYAVWMLMLMSFAESSFFPLPPDLLLIPIVLAQRNRAFLIAGLCTLSSVLGGFFGYAIGSLLYDSIGAPVLNFYGYLDKFTEFQNLYNHYGAWIVFGAGLTPFPYKVITIASGVTGLDLWVFGIASVIGRGVRFFLVAGLLWYFGAAIEKFIDRNFGWLSILFFVLLVGGFAVLKFL